MRATGHNTVSISFHWGYHSPNENTIDFSSESGKDIQYMFDAAKKAGLYVIARAGPYIHADTTAGGLPGWLLHKNNLEARSGENTYTQAWIQYYAELVPIIARNQLDRGGPVIAFQIENEYKDSDIYPFSIRYMKDLADTARQNGIVMPIFHNDASLIGAFLGSKFSGILDLYGVDSYPRGFNCSHPMENFHIKTDYRSSFNRIAKYTPKFSPAFQGGAADSWGGYGYESCADMFGSEFANVFYRNNVAQKFTMMSHYMTVGGTSWGHLASPDVYTSYDNGAAISETRILRDKANEVKLLWKFLHVSPSLLNANYIADSNQYAYTNNADVFVTELRDPDTLVGYYIVRSTDTNSLDGKAYRLRIRTLEEGEIMVPYKGWLTLQHRESKIVVTDYRAGPLSFGYSTLEIYTWSIVNEKPILVMYGSFEDLNEMSIRNKGMVPHSFFKVRGDEAYENTKYRAFVTPDSNDLRLTFLLNGEEKAVIQSHDYILLMINRPDIYKVWAPSIGSEHDPDTPPESQIIIVGPYLVRNVSETDFGSALDIYGDIDLEENGGDVVEVFADDKYRIIKWNGVPMKTVRSKYTSRIFRVPTPESTEAKIEIQQLADVRWRALDSVPESSRDYDDSLWTTADKGESSNKFYKPKTSPVLYPGEYGYHTGPVIYRGHFIGSAARGARLSIFGGSGFAYTAWINGRYIGSFEGRPNVESIDEILHFPPGALSEVDDNVLVVIADNMGYEVDKGANGHDAHSMLKPRGIQLAALISSDKDEKLEFSRWTIQGNAGGETFDDRLRAPYNEGGTYAQRIGAHFETFDDSSWPIQSPLITMELGSFYSHEKGAGIKFYRAHVSIKVPKTMDVPLGIRIQARPGVRAEIFINGWQYGRYISDIGPQDEFPVPPGILNMSGDNVIAIQVWAVNDRATAGLESLEWVMYGKYLSGYGQVSHNNYGRQFGVDRLGYYSPLRAVY
ncbi:glycoside hydrolase superfamily [Dipodascopsis uninucleata]